MRIEVELPDLGQEAEEKATVAFWLIEEGDEVEEGEDVVELTTDKAAFTMPSPRKGVLAERLVEEGDEVAVGDLICILEV